MEEPGLDVAAGADRDPREALGRLDVATGVREPRGQRHQLRVRVAAGLESPHRHPHHVIVATGAGRLDRVGQEPGDPEAGDGGHAVARGAHRAAGGRGARGAGRRPLRR